MRELWKAYGLIVGDKTLRDSVSAKVNVNQRVDLP